MMFRRSFSIKYALIQVALSVALLAAAPQSAEAEPTAVVPTRVIYPGETLDASMLKQVVVTNPNIRDDYIATITQAAGLVSNRTLLPGRVIPPSKLREPWKVERGRPTKLVYRNGTMMISASGTALQDAATGELIQARNADTGVIVSGTVMADGTIRVVIK